MLDKHSTDDLNKGLSKLSPLQKFIFDYGLFLLEWNDFDILLEVLIYHLRTKVLNERISLSRNYRDVNSMQVREKRSELKYLLQYAKRHDVMEAIEKVYDVADRNEWVHGKMLYFQLPSLADRVIRFNPEQPDRRYAKTVNVSLDSIPFTDFREAYDECSTVICRAFEFDGNTCLKYLLALDQERNQNQVNAPPIQ